jgi:hypothetical protein
MAADDPKVAVMMNSPVELRSKVTGGGYPSPEMLTNADEKIRKVGARYTEWTLKDIERLPELLKQALEDPADRHLRITDILAFRMTCAAKAPALIFHL